MADSKARWIHKLLGELHAAHGAFSLEYLRLAGSEEIIAMLTTYDGVGYKTAACVCLFGLGRDVFPVDTHVHRLCNRLGLVRTHTPDKTFAAMQPLVPKGRAYQLHTNLIRLEDAYAVHNTPDAASARSLTNVRGERKIILPPIPSSEARKWILCCWIISEQRISKTFHLHSHCMLRNVLHPASKMFQFFHAARPTSSPLYTVMSGHPSHMFC